MISFFKYSVQIALVLLLGIGLINCQAPQKPKIILDTDIGGDIDDLGALYLLHKYADDGLCEILGVTTSWSMVNHISGVDAVNTWFGRPDIPVGVYKNSLYFKKEYTWYLSDQFPNDITGREAPTATTVLRQILASQADTSVTIVVTGRLNNIYHLFKTEPDSISPLNGFELAEQKVKNYYIMGGRYPKGSKQEANFQNSSFTAKYVIDNCTRPMIFNGGAIGHKNNGYAIGSAFNQLADDNILKAGYSYFFQNPPEWTKMQPTDTIQDWSIWDLITVQVAVTGVQDYFETVTSGYNSLDSTGYNYWVEQPDKNHTYLVPKMDPETYSKNVIEKKLLEQ